MIQTMSMNWLKNSDTFPGLIYGERKRDFECVSLHLMVLTQKIQQINKINN